MKLCVIVVVGVILRVSQAGEGSVPIHGVVAGGPWPRVRDAPNIPNPMAERDHCNADNVLRALRNPTRSIEASSFCSTYLQPTVSHLSTATYNITTIITDTITTTATSSTFDNTVGTTTELCVPPTPTASLTCDYLAAGYAYNLLSSTAPVENVTCHENCLENPKCLSFQVEGPDAFGDNLYHCNLYNVSVAGNVIYTPYDNWTFYDRDCPELLPTGCTPPALRKRVVTVPPYLATVNGSRISSACSCFIKSPDPTTTESIVYYSAETITKYAFTSETVTTIETDYPSIVTVYTTVT